jgi:hypothetical protein
VIAPVVIVLLAACYAPGSNGILGDGGNSDETSFTLLLPQAGPESSVERTVAVPGRAMMVYPPTAAILGALDYTIQLSSLAGTRTMTVRQIASIRERAPAGPLYIDVRATLNGSPYASGSLTVDVKRNGANEFVVPLYKDANGFLTVGGTITSDYPAGPLAGAAVQLRQGPLLVGQTVMTDAAGKWSVAGVGPGDGYYIHVNKIGYNQGISAPFSVTGPGGGADLNLTAFRVINVSLPMTGDVTESDWVYTHSNKTYTIQDGANLFVMGMSTGGRRLAVASGAQNVTLTLWNAVIDVSTENDACALLLQSGSSLTLRLEGTSTLKSGDNRAGIQTSGAEISITGNGTLNVLGGEEGAGIGGGNNEDGGTIEISGGILVATGGDQGAGIGGGNNGDGGTIRISGGILAATGGDQGAGIGGGYNGDGGTIRISGGMASAVGSNKGAGIGGSNFGAGADITITGGTITARGEAKAIGGGSFASAPNGTLTITPVGIFTTYTYWANTATLDPGGAGTSGTYTLNPGHKYVKIMCR